MVMQFIVWQCISTKRINNMNKKGYLGDPRYARVYEDMELLGIVDISTKRHSDNGTIVWRLPIKDQDSGILIEVASFKTGYVRNQGKSTRSNFQLNKRCEGEPQYFDSGKRDSMDRPMYTKWTTRTCKLIPIEIDRLEYLISYCLKNYYIKNANSVPNGEYIPKWKHEYELERHDVDREINDLQVIVDGRRYRVI